MKKTRTYKGINKLFVGGILSLAGSVCVWLSAIPGILGISAVFNGSFGGFFAGGIVALLLLLAGLLLPIIAYILKLVGLEQAGGEEALFRQGFLFAVLALIFVLVETLFAALNIADEGVSGVVQTVSGALDIVVTIYVIFGIQNLARRREDYRLVYKGASLVKYITVFYAASLFAGLLSVLFGSNLLIGLLAGILAFITSVLNLIVYIMYLVYLGRTKKMLKNSKEMPIPSGSIYDIVSLGASLENGTSEGT